MNHMEVMKRIATDSSLTLTQIRVLLAILSFSRKQKKQIARSYLSHLLNISPHNISRTTTILVEKGYLKKTKLKGVTSYEWVSGETRYQERHRITTDTLKMQKVSPQIPPDTIYNNYTVLGKDIQKGGSGGETDPIPYSEIIRDLNEVAEKSFMSSGQKNRELIRARWNDGFRLKDFLHVHKVKTEEWKSNVDMNKFLRPETLYSNKFHGYVNEKLKEEIEKIAEQEKMNSPETQEDIEYLRMLTGNTKQLN
jgi:uncharacterized phage protein (TIGR02220 family)